MSRLSPVQLAQYEAQDWSSPTEDMAEFLSSVSCACMSDEESRDRVLALLQLAALSLHTAHAQSLRHDHLSTQLISRDADGKRRRLVSQSAVTSLLRSLGEQVSVVHATQRFLATLAELEAIVIPVQSDLLIGWVLSTIVMVIGRCPLDDAVSSTVARGCNARLSQPVTAALVDLLQAQCRHSHAAIDTAKLRLVVAAQGPVNEVAWLLSVVISTDTSLHAAVLELARAAWRDGSDSALRVIALGLGASASVSSFTELLVDGYLTSFEESVHLSIALSRYSAVVAGLIVTAVCDKISPKALARLISQRVEGNAPADSPTVGLGLITETVTAALTAHEQAYALYSYIEALSSFPLDGAAENGLRCIQLKFISSLARFQCPLSSFQQHARDLSTLCLAKSVPAIHVVDDSLHSPIFQLFLIVGSKSSLDLAAIMLSIFIQGAGHHDVFNLCATVRKIILTWLDPHPSVFERACAHALKITDSQSGTDMGQLFKLFECLVAPDCITIEGNL